MFCMLACCMHTIVVFHMPNVDDCERINNTKHVLNKKLTIIVLFISDGEMKSHEGLKLFSQVVHKRVHFSWLHLLTIPPGGQRV